MRISTLGTPFWGEYLPAKLKHMAPTFEEGNECDFVVFEAGKLAETNAKNSPLAVQRTLCAARESLGPALGNGHLHGVPQLLECYLQLAGGWRAPTRGRDRPVQLFGAEFRRFVRADQ